MDALATVDDLAARMATEFTDAEAGAMALALDDVSALARLYGSPAWGDTLPVPAPVRAVVLAAVERRARNPEGYVQEMAGEYMYRLPEAAGAAFRADELAVIRQCSGRTGIASVPVERPVTVARDIHYPHGVGRGDF
ncbi:hypothetical protein ACIP5N_27745 [Streptomyces sp. NPDC088768]|uniref:hypothetical protein n=1 Tax=Streptomyces sp. NPDC088768 TaxID=3365894 RepID=UPI0037FF9CA8